MQRLSTMRCMPFCLLALVLGLQNPGQAETEAPPWKQVQHYFDALDSYRATFVQEVARAGNNRDVSRGEVILQRPNRFRWDYREPYRQLVLGDGEKLWHFDEDLAQVTVQKLDDALGGSPLSQLMSGTPINELFRVERLEKSPVGNRFRLEPLGPEAEFGSLELTFSEGNLAVLELEDVLGQRTRVAFSEVETNIVVPPATWIFQPPAGTDVIGDG